MGREPFRTKVPKPFHFAVAAIRPPVMLLTRRDWHGQENLPQRGGFIAAANHLSEVDPIMLAHFLVDNGTPPLFLAKDSLFRIPVVGSALKAFGQVPVYRGTAQAGDSLAAAEQAVRAGSCVTILPEGTLTRDPELWPMRAKTGVGRVALATRAPVIPVAQWGPQDLLAPYARIPKGLFSRPTMRITAGPAVELGDLYGREKDPAALREATDRITSAITAELAQIRGEEPPATPFVWRSPRRSESA